MLKLVWNEWIKFFMRPGTYIMLGMIVALFVLISALSTLNPSPIDGKKTYDSSQWKQEVQTDIEEMTHELSQLQTKNSGEGFDVDKIVKQSVYEQEIPRLQYYLKHDVIPPAMDNFYNSVLTTTQFTNLIAIMVVVISSGLMSREHQMGTIKLLLIRPVSRLSIFISKWLLVIITSIIFVLFTYGVSAAFSAFQTKMNPTDQIAIYDMMKGKYYMVDFWPFLLKLLFDDILFVTIFGSLAYVISVIFKNTAAAQGITLGFLFFSGLITNYIASKTDFVKYLWPANWNLNQYMHMGAEAPIKEMTYGFSLTYDIIHLAVIIIIAAWIFMKRDVAG